MPDQPAPQPAPRILFSILRITRILWSIPWAIAAILFAVMWVRSNQFAESAQWSATKWTGFQFTSQHSQFTVRLCELDGAGHHGSMDFPPWSWYTGPLGSFGPSPSLPLFQFKKWFWLATPFWAPVAIAATLAVAPFLISLRRFHFSLRTLLIATTLAALLLGLAVWMAR